MSQRKAKSLISNNNLCHPLNSLAAVKKYFFSTNTKSRLVSDFLKGSGRAQRKLKKPFKFETMTKSKELPKGTKGFDSAGKSVIFLRMKSKETVLVARLQGDKA